MELPLQLLQSLSHTPGFDRQAFVNIHTTGEQITSVRTNPVKQSKIHPSPGSGPNSKILWTEFGYYLDTRPSFTFDPLFHAGCYYVQEASSMFLEQALKQLVDLSKPLKLLDLCAAPGGKSTHIQSLISKDSLLVSNEVIRSRAAVLKDNIIKWGCENVIVTNNDPKDFSKLENYFDVIVVDAPCSGSGLFRRDPEAINEWSVNNVQLCSQRQQRILADVLPALKKDGVFIYSTCSYSKEEDEDIVDWLIKECSMLNVQCTIKKDWGIVESGGGYRFWPDKVKGEGFFIACFQKTDGDNLFSLPGKRKMEQLTKKEVAVVSEWTNSENFFYFKHNETVFAWPQQHAYDFGFLLQQLRVIYSGIKTGELMRDKLVPDHALAMSGIVSDKVKRMELDTDNVIRYLQRKELLVQAVQKGWQLAAYKGHALGWMNVLASRINNYYPKELRILKDY